MPPTRHKPELSSFFYRLNICFDTIRVKLIIIYRINNIISLVNVRISFTICHPVSEYILICQVVWNSVIIWISEQLTCSNGCISRLTSACSRCVLQWNAFILIQDRSLFNLLDYSLDALAVYREADCLFVCSRDRSQSRDVRKDNRYLVV